MTEALRVAIIGAGQIAQRAHLPGFARAGARVVALCDNRNPRLAEIAQEYGVKRTCLDWREMLKEGGFEAVSVCTPPAFHSEMAIESAQRGYHVLVEKPMALTLEQCDRMIEAATKAGVLLTVSHNQRFVPSHVLAKEILDSGRLGKPYLVHAVFGHRGPEAWSPTQQWYFRPDLAGYGVIADLGSHKIDLMRWLLSQDVTEVAAFASTFEKATSLDDTMVCTLRFSGGTLATLQVSWVFRPDWENSLVLRCERGVIRIPTEAADPVRVSWMNESGSTVESTHQCKDSDPAGWSGMVAAFVQAVTQHQPAPVSGEDGRATLAAVLAAHESASAQQVVHVTI